MKAKFFKVSLLVLALLIISALALPAFAQNVSCYFEQGGSKFIATVFRSQACEWEMRTGSLLDVQAGATTTFANDPTFTGAPVFSGTTVFSDAVDFNSSVDIRGVLTSDTGALTITDAVDIDGNLTSATGALTITDDVDIDGALTSATGALTITDAVDIDGALTSATGAITITDDVDIAGNLTSATGAVTITDALLVTGAAYFTSPVVATAVTWMDDFLGTTVLAMYTEVSGADGQALQTIVEEQFGVYQLTSGDVGDGVANDLEAFYLSLEWSADQGALIFETRLHLDTDVVTVELCAGFTDDVTTVELPFTNSADTVTAVADNAIAFCFDTNATTDEWWVNGANGGTEGTGIAATGVVPVADTYQTLRIEIDPGGEDCRFYIDSVLVGTITANCVLNTALLAPGVSISSGGNAGSNAVDVDYMYAAATRD